MSNIPARNVEVVQNLLHFIAEDAKQARRFLKKCNYPAIEKANILLLNEHTQQNSRDELLAPLLSGYNVGLMSDAGCPGIADPGAEVVALAHKQGITVEPLTGPSSIVLSIMASGFNGQNFAFVGYLPVDRVLRAKRVKELEQMAAKYKQAQFFIETPYRNQQMLETLMSCLHPNTHLFAGIELGGINQLIVCKPAAVWKKETLPVINKRPVVFGIY